MRTRRAWGALVCGALLASCIYDFDNPVATLPGGALTGRLVLQSAAAGQSLDGGTVKLAWSGLSVPLDSSGFFGFLDLPDGTYTLVYDIPQPAGEPPFIGVIRDVLIPTVSGGADAVDLGEIPVSPDGVVVGTVVGGEDPMIVAAFVALDGGGEQLESQSFATTTADGGQYQLTVPAGDRILVASSATLSAELPFTLSASQTLQLSPLVLQAPATDGGSAVVGNLIFGGPGRGASASAAVVSSLTQSLAASDFPPLGGAVALQQQIPQVGLPFAQAVRPGRPYDFVCTIEAAEAASGDSTFDPLSIKKLPVLAGRATNLGPVPWLPRAVFLANDGGESSPVWAGLPGAPSLVEPGTQNAASSDGGGCELGVPTDGGPVEKLLVLPPVTSGSLDLLVWSEQSGVIWSADYQGCGFQTMHPTAGDAVPSTLVGARDDDGGAVIAWGIQGGGVQVAYDYASQGNWGAFAVFDAGEAVAVAAGGHVLFTTADDSTLELLAEPAGSPIALAAPPGTFAGLAQLAVASCETDGVAGGICLAWTDLQGGLHGALANPNLSTITAAAAGSLIATGAEFPSIASLVDPTTGASYVALAWVGSGRALQWGYLTSMTDPSQWVLQTVGVSATGTALLLPWQGVPLAIYQSPDLTMAATALPAGAVPSPVFPGDAGTSQAPSGYAGTDGTLSLGLIDVDGVPGLFLLAP